MRIDLEYDTAQFDAEVSTYVDTSIGPAIVAGLTAAAPKVQAELARDIDDPKPSSSSHVGRCQISIIDFSRLILMPG